VVEFGFMCLCCPRRKRWMIFFLSAACGILRAVPILQTTTKMQVDFFLNMLCSAAYGMLRTVPAVQCVAVCCSVLQCVVVCCSALQCVVACCNVMQCVVSS